MLTQKSTFQLTAEQKAILEGYHAVTITEENAQFYYKATEQLREELKFPMQINNVLVYKMNEYHEKLKAKRKKENVVKELSGKGAKNAN